MAGLSVSHSAHVDADTPIRHLVYPAGDTRPYVVVRLGTFGAQADVFLHNTEDLERLEATVKAARADLAAAQEAANEHSRKTFEALAAL